jgi:oligopeptide transport system substrate-binding protein
MAKQTHMWRIAQIALLLGSLALLLAGCDVPWQAKQPDMAKDQTLKMDFSSEAAGQYTVFLDPTEAYDALSTQTTSLLFDGLVTLDRNEHIEPWGARSWTISPDGLTYTFTLRPIQRFSDGAPVKPSDYAWSMDRAVNPCLGTPLAYYLAAIKDASAFSAETCSDGQPVGAITTLVGDSIVPNDSANTLTITLAQPVGYFLAALSYPLSSVVERGVVAGADLGKDGAWVKNLTTGATGQGGSGMFYVAGLETGAQDALTRLMLKPNPNWWGLHAGKKPHFSEIDFITSGVSSTDSSVFRSDPTIAWTTILSTDPDIPLMKKQAYYHEQPALILSGIVLNWKIAPFDDLNARKAFCLALNRDDVNRQAYQGLYIPSWHLVPQGMDGYNAQVKGIDGVPTTGDIALAQHYWQRYLAAHHNTVPRITFSDRSFSQLAQAAISFYEEAWSQVLGVSVTTYFVHTIVDDPSSQQMYRFAWQADYPDPQDFLSPLFMSDAPYNTQSASVPAADDLMRQADALPDMRQRLPLYQQAEQLLIDNVAICPLYQWLNRYGLRPWVKGDFVEDARGVFPNDAWVSGYIAKH